MTRILVLALTLAGVVASDPLFAWAADEKNPLAGTWSVVKSEEDGKPSVELVKAKLTFMDGDKLFIKELDKANPLEVTFKLDAAKKPKHIDLTRTIDGRAETATGIWELDGDKLKLCVAEPEVKERPTEFKSKSRKVIYLELTRDKP